MVEIIPNWHPMFVHFTVALVCVSGVLFVLSRLVTNWRLEDQWLAAAYWMLWIGALLSVGTVIAGWDAFNTVEHDTVSHGAMLEHRNLALVTFIVIILMTIWSIVQYVKENAPSLVFMLCMLLTVGMVASTAWHGAELVYRHGLGVMALPQKTDHSHDAMNVDHDHGHGDVSASSDASTQAPATELVVEAPAAEAVSAVEAEAPAVEEAPIVETVPAEEAVAPAVEDAPVAEPAPTTEAAPAAETIH